MFGLSTPAAKILLGSVHPAVLAGLFYCGAGLGVAMLRQLRADHAGPREMALGRRDVPWLIGSVASGGWPAPSFS